MDTPLIVFAVVLSGFLLCTTTDAQNGQLDAERDWANGGTDFNSGANWFGGIAPGLGDVAWFKTVEGVQPNVSASLSLSGLYFQSAASSGYDITNTNGAALTLTGSAADVSGSETSDATAAAIGANNTSGTNTIDVPLILAPTSGSTSTFFQATGGTLGVNGAISGSGISLTKAGGGTLVLTGQNAYTGGTNINGGTLQFGKEVSLYNDVTSNWTATNIIVASGATAAFNVGGTGEFTSADIDILKALGTASGGFTSGSFLALDTTSASGGTFTYSSNIANPNSGANVFGLTKLGTGTLVLSGTNTYTGGTSFSTGSLQLGSSGVVSAGGSITSGPVGTGTLTITGGTLSSDSTTARTIQNSLVLGTVTLGDATKNGTLTFNSTDGSNTLATPAKINLSFDPTWTVNSPVVIADVISGFGSLTLAGSSTLTLSAAATYQGNTTISSGTLKLGAANVLPQVNSDSAVIVNGTLDLNTFNQTIYNIFGGGTIDTVAGGTPILTIAGRTGPSTFFGVIQNTAGTLSLNVTGFLTLNGKNTYTGATTISATGILGLGSGFGNASLSTSSTITDNGVLTFEALTAVTVTQGIDFSGSPITGTGNLTVASGNVGFGPLTLNAANTYSGGTTLQSGILQLGSSSTGSVTSGPVGTGTLTLIGGTLSSDSTTARTIANAVTISGGVTLGNATKNGMLTFSGPITLSQGGFTVNSDVTYSGNIGGAAPLVKDGPGTLILSGSNTYSSGTDIVSGPLSVSSIGNSGASSPLGTNGTISFGSPANPGGGTLKYTGIGETTNKVINFQSGNPGGATIDQSGTGLLKFTSNLTGGFSDRILTLQGSTSGTGELSGVISNPSNGRIFSVLKNGTGAWTLSGANTYTGATTVNGGSLLINGSLASGSGVSVSNAGTILGGTGTVNGAVTVNAGAKLQGGDGTVGTALSLSGSLNLTDDSIIELVLGPSATHSTLARTGSGTWTFDSNQAFTFLESATPSGTYQSIITGLSSDPGTESNWTITNPDFTGAFTYNGGNIDLTISEVPEPGTWAAAVLALGVVVSKQRRRLGCGYVSVARKPQGG